MSVTQNRLATIGDAEILSVSVSLSSSGGIPDLETWPEFPDNAAQQEDRFFRYILEGYCYYSTPNDPNPDSTYSVDRVGQGISGSSLWRIYRPDTTVNTGGGLLRTFGESYHDNTSFNNWAFADVFRRLRLYPGEALQFTALNSIASNSTFDVELRVAVARDPDDLSPYVGAATGGISGRRIMGG